MKASDIKKGMIVRFRGQVCAVRNLQVQLPSSRGSSTLYKLRLQDVQTSQNIDEAFRGDDVLEEVAFTRRPASYSYFDGDMHVFLDQEDYSQYSLSPDDVEAELPYLTEGMEGIYVLVIEDNAVGIQLPTTVVKEVIETAPGIKGASATKRTKPAKLDGGLEVHVPEYITTGENVKVNTETGEYAGRA